MNTFGNLRVKWPYATHLVDRSRVKTLVPIEFGHDPGALVLARVLEISRHKEIESSCGCKMTLSALKAPGRTGPHQMRNPRRRHRSARMPILGERLPNSNLDRSALCTI